VVFKAHRQTAPQFHCKTVHELRWLISSQLVDAPAPMAICTKYALMFSVFAFTQVMKVIAGLNVLYIAQVWKKQFKLHWNGLATGT